MIEVRQAVQIVQVPGDRGVLAVDLQGVERLVAAGVAGRLEGGERAVVEARQEGAGVVDADRLDFPGQRVLALLMKVSVIAETRSMPPLSQSAVSMQCARRSPVTPLPATLTSSRHSAAPPCGRSLRDRPVLQELGAVMEDPAQPALVDELLGQRHGRDAAVVVPDHIRHAGGFDRLHHPL